MAITPLPTPPSREDPTNFATRADAFMAALPTFATETNATAVEVDNDRASAASSASTATTQAGLANAQRVLAETAASNAETSATNASASATASAASAASAAALAGAFVGTSTTSLTIGLGSKTFTTQTGEQYTAGIWVSAVSAANGANYMFGQVTSYSGTSLVVDVQATGGSGTLADWNLSLAGVRGPAGVGITPQTVGFTLTGGTTAKTYTGDVDLIASKVITTDNLTVGSISATASGSITANAPVVVNSDGTVSNIVGNALDFSALVGLTTESGYGAATKCPIAVNTAGNQVVVVWSRTYAPYGVYAFVGNISGGVITWGTEQQLYNNYYAAYSEGGIDICYLANQNKYVIAFASSDSNNYLVRTMLCSVSGTTVTVDTYHDLVNSSAGQRKNISCIVDPVRNVLAVGYYDYNNYSTTYLKVGTYNVSSSLVYGTSWNFPYVSSQTYSGLYDATSGAIVYIYSSNSSNHTALVRFTITDYGTASFGTPVVLYSNTSGSARSIAYDPVNNLYVALYSPYATDGIGLKTVTISAGGTITLGTETRITNSSYNRALIRFDQRSNKFWVSHQNNGGSTNYISTVNVSGTTITISGTTSYGAYNEVLLMDEDYADPVYIPGIQKTMNVFYRSTSPFGHAYRTITPAYTTGTDSNVIGFASANYTNGQTANVKIIGSTVNGLSGLTPAKKYYAQANGTIATTPDTNFTAFIGTSLSSTSLLVKG